MADLCQIPFDKKLLNWPILVPEPVIFQDYFKFLMDVCQKFLEGTCLGKVAYNAWSGTRMCQFNNFLLSKFWQKLSVFVNANKLIDSPVSCNKKLEQSLVWWPYYGLWYLCFGLFTIFRIDGMETIFVYVFNLFS